MRPVLLSLILLAGCSDVLLAPTLTLNVTFAGATTCPADVDSVQVTESTGALPQTTVPCTAGKATVVAIINVAPGTYDVHIAGLLNGAETWSASQQFVISATASNTFNVALDHTAGTVLFDFLIAAPQPATMKGGMTCAQAEITNVTIVVDPGSSDAAMHTVPCFDMGSMSARAQLTGISPGMHAFDVSAADSMGKTIWDAPIPAQMISATEPNDFYVNLQGTAPGPLGVSLALPSGETCTAAGVQQVKYQLTNPDGSQGESGTAACTNGNNVVIGNGGMGALPAGVYSITMQGCDSTGNTCPFESTGAPTPVGNIFVLPESLPSPLPVVTMVQQ